MVGLGLSYWSVASQKAGDTVVITVDGDLYGEYPLDTDQEIDIIDGDHSNHITIKNGSCQMTYSNCYNQVCVDTGAITKTGKQIVCLPHKICVEIKSKSGGDIDVISQ